MKKGEKIGMAVFGLLVVGGVGLSVREGAQQRAQVANYVSRHGWSVSREPDAKLGGLLERLAPDERWGPYDVIRVERPPESLYLFRYQAGSKEGNSRWLSKGVACVAEHTGRAHGGPVVVFPHTPGVDALVPDKVQAGSEDFRNTYTVQSKQDRDAREAVRPEVERVLLEHRAGPGWYLTIVVEGRALLVASSWAQSEEEWDYLISLTQRLRTAVR